MKSKYGPHHGLTRGYGGKFLVVLPVVVGNLRQLAIPTELSGLESADEAARFFDIALKCLLPYTRPGTEPNFPGAAFEEIDVNYWGTQPETIEVEEDRFRQALFEASEKLKRYATDNGFSLDDLESRRHHEMGELAEKKLVEGLLRAKNIAQTCVQTAGRVNGLRDWFEKVVGNEYSSRVLNHLGGTTEREAVRVAAAAYVNALKALGVVLDAAIEREKAESPKLAKENPTL